MTFTTVISWPEDPDRTVEVYEFDDTDDQFNFTEQCVLAANMGWEPLQGAKYLMMTVYHPSPDNRLPDGSRNSLPPENFTKQGKSQNCNLLHTYGQPTPANISVHLANEHKIDPDELAPHQRYARHLEAHMYAQFRPDEGHYHTEEIL